MLIFIQQGEEKNCEELVTFYIDLLLGDLSRNRLFERINSLQWPGGATL